MQKGNPAALLPIAVVLLLYLGLGLLFEYGMKIPMGFYNIPIVIAFLAAGLLQLRQAVPVVFGANIGTTVTAQLLAFRVESWRYLLLFCGVLLCLACKGWRGRCVGETVFGFGLLFGLSGVVVESDWLRAVLGYAMVMNLMLGAFNLLPGFPMDGGRIFRCVMRVFVSRAKATYYAMIVGRVSAVALVILPMLQIYNIWIIPIGGSLFLRLLIAWMIWREGYREYLMARQEENFRNWTQADFEARVSPPPYDR